jgi:rhamnogalacturonyl hydrolase YesR
VVVIRWSSWLRAAIWYAYHLPQVIEVVESWRDDGILVKNAKIVVINDILFKELCQIKSNYSVLITILDDFESSKHGVESGVDVLNNLHFNDDICGI